MPSGPVNVKLLQVDSTPIQMIHVAEMMVYRPSFPAAGKIALDGYLSTENDIIQRDKPPVDPRHPIAGLREFCLRLPSSIPTDCRFLSLMPSPESE